jgi:hypothetical protein
MNRLNIKDSDGLVLKPNGKVSDKQGNTFTIAFIDGLGRYMFDEDRGMWSKMFELGAFPVRLVNEH